MTPMGRGLPGIPTDLERPCHALRSCPWPCRRFRARSWSVTALRQFWFGLVDRTHRTDQRLQGNKTDRCRDLARHFDGVGDACVPDACSEPDIRERRKSSVRGQFRHAVVGLANCQGNRETAAQFTATLDYRELCRTRPLNAACGISRPTWPTGHGTTDRCQTHCIVWFPRPDPRTACCRPPFFPFGPQAAQLDARARSFAADACGF